MLHLFAPYGDSVQFSVSSTSARQALPSFPSGTQAVALVGLQSGQAAWYVKFGDNTVTATTTTSLKVKPGTPDEPLILPVPASETYIAILCEGQPGNVIVTSGILLAGDTTTIISDNAVTNAKLADMAAYTLKGRNAGTTGDPSDIDISALTEKTTLAADDLFLLQDSAASNAFKKVKKSNITPTAAALTKTDDTNVTLTLGGAPTTALLAATSITAGWTGVLSKARGGTATSDWLASPTFTGTPAAPTASVDTNTTQIATTAMVLAQAAAATPLGNAATAVVGTSTRFARADHVHPGREVLTAARTYYVRTDGSDSNTGLVNSSGGAFLTIQKAVDVAAALDLSIYDVTIQLVNGTYTVGAQFKTITGAGTIIIIGDETTPGNVIVSISTGGHIFGSSDGTAPWLGVYQVRGVNMTSTGGARSALCAAGAGATIKFQKCEFAAVSEHHMVAVYGGIIICTGNYTINGNPSGWHVVAAYWSMVLLGQTAPTVTLSGTPAMSGFALATGLAFIRAGGITFSGSATGQRYNVSLNAAIDVGGGGATYLPGNSAGATATGGQYA